MLKTKQKSKMQFSNLYTDFEIINPIESKTILGGDWYTLDEVTVTGYRKHNSYNPWDTSNPGWYGPNDWNGRWGAWGDYGSYNDLGDNLFDDLKENLDDQKSQTFSNHICNQGTNTATCAPIALSYVANYYGANGLTASDFAEMRGHNYEWMNLGIGGMSGSDLKFIMDKVFVSRILDGSTGSIEVALGKGQPIIASIDLGNGNGHEVVITGFDFVRGKVSYMDPAYGNLQTSDVNDIKFTSQLYAVMGVQNNNYVKNYRNDKNDTSNCTICAK